MRKKDMGTTVLGTRRELLVMEFGAFCVDETAPGFSWLQKCDFSKSIRSSFPEQTLAKKNNIYTYIIYVHRYTNYKSRSQLYLFCWDIWVPSTTLMG